MPNATFLFEGIDKASVPIIFTSCLLWSLCLVMVSLGIAASCNHGEEPSKLRTDTSLRGFFEPLE